MWLADILDIGSTENGLSGFLQRSKQKEGYQANGNPPLSSRHHEPFTICGAKDRFGNDAEKN
jgi:hypothetical protein